jgi:hypothetical protein
MFRRMGILLLFSVTGSLLSWVFSPSQAYSQESLGTLGVSGIYLEPTFTFAEPKRSSFDAGRSFLAISWTREPVLSATLKVGSRSLIGTPARYGPAPVDELGLIEGYAQADSVIGRVRAGLVPISFSLEGGDTEERLRFPRSLLFANRIINLRDYGVSYHIGYEGMFSDWSIHNGEGGTDLDNRMWYTFRAGYQVGRRYKIGISGATGSTTPASTDPEGTALPADSARAGLDVGQSAKIRLANFFAEAQFDRVNLLTEFTTGDITQPAGEGKLGGGHFDIEWEASESHSFLARYDRFDPSISGGDKVNEYMVGWGWKSLYANSVLYVFGSKQSFEGPSPDVHRAIILWRITPQANSFRSPL